jgi:Toc86/159 family protein import component
MENGDGVVEKSHTGDVNSLPDAVFEKSEVIPTNGSEETRDSDDLEDSTGVQTSVLDSINNPIREEENAEKDLSSTELQVENFEEAVVASDSVEELSVHQLEDVNVVSVSDTIDAQTPFQRLELDELKVLDADAVVQNGSDKSSGVSYLGAPGLLALVEDDHDVNDTENRVHSTVNLDQTRAAGTIDDQDCLFEIGVNGETEHCEDDYEVNEKSPNGLLNVRNLTGTPVVQIIDEKTVTAAVATDEVIVQYTNEQPNGKESDTRSEVKSVVEGESCKEFDEKDDVVMSNKIHSKNQTDVDYRKDVTTNGNVVHEVAENPEVVQAVDILTSDHQMEKNGELEEAETINQDQDLQEEKTTEQIDTLAKLGHVESGNSEEEFNIEDKECSLVEEKTINVDVSTPLSSKDSSLNKDVKIQPAPSRSGSSDSSVNKPTVEVKVKEVKQSTVTTVANSSSTPAGLGPGASLREPVQRSAAVATQPSRANGTVHQAQTQLVDDRINTGEADESDETREKLQMIRVKFLRLAHRLGQTPHNVVVAQVLYRLGLAEQLRGRNGSRVAAFSFDRASAMAEQLEAAGQEPLDFTCTIMVLGKTGVGKSATINSIFDENKFSTDAFQLGTKKVQDVVGTVQGIKVRVIDTPGLLSSWSDQRQNVKILQSVKRFIKKSPPDIVLYLDRLDMQTRDFGDMPLLRTITEIFGVEIWFNAIVVLTHAASAPPEGPNGTATGYDMFVTQRSHAVQQAIRQTAGDMRLMNPVTLVENHSACRTNRAGQRILPNGQVWKPHLLLLSFASKILFEANTLLKLYESPGKPPQSRTPPLPIILSSLLQSRPQLKSPQDQLLGDDDDVLDDDSSSDSDGESEYDALPPFKPLNKEELSELSNSQKKEYYVELEYRERLLMKKMLKEEKRRRKMMKKMVAAARELPVEENVEEENRNEASVPVVKPDMALPPSFDSDDLIHRYRELDSTNPWRMLPVLYSNGWDHDLGYEGANVERLFAVSDNIPLSFSGQVTKDKRYANLQMELASSLKHGAKKSTTVAFDVQAQTQSRDITCTLRSETLFSNHRLNKATASVSVTHVGDSWTTGVKVEDKLTVGRWAQFVLSGGTVYARGDAAYGGSLEATLRDKDDPLGRFLTTVGASVMDWHGDLAIGWNAQTQIPVGRSSNLIGRFNVNNRGSGQVSLRLNCSEPLQIALVALLPCLNKLWAHFQPHMQQ